MTAIDPLTYRQHQEHKERIARIYGAGFAHVDRKEREAKARIEKMEAEALARIEVAKARIKGMEDYAAEQLRRAFPKISSWAKFKRIKALVCETYGITQIDLISDHRTKDIVRPRQVVCYLAKKFTVLSFPAIGRLLRRDHTSIMHGVTKITQMRAADPDFDAEIAALERQADGGGQS